MTAAIRLSIILALVGGIGAADGVAQTAAEEMTPARVRAALDGCVRFLLADQNPDGSWGGARNAVYTFTGDVWSNPETHRAWKVGTTGLCCLALAEFGDSEAAKQAVDRSVDYLLAKAAVKRPSDWDTMNCWAYIYGLQALAAANGLPRYANTPRCEQISVVGQKLIQRLAETQSSSGGWGYLEFEVPRTRRLQWATSFTTAAGVIALLDARAQGFEVDEALLRRAVRGVQRCRLPSGAYTYSIQAIADPRTLEWIDQIKGSLSRIQVCNLALHMAGEEVPAEWLETGLGHFFREHRFLDIARNRPIPHEAFYYNSGYFYMFGHYYAARVIELLPPEQRAACWPRLQREVVKIQQKDGSLWDYDMHAYHKPYGTAYGLLTLGHAARDQK
ncbi:MAG: hypothetical protein KKB50_16560 [Planctomycetes bacterium]|nr:hypothetical protein [Planctomycetota bacterium]